MVIYQNKFNDPATRQLERAIKEGLPMVAMQALNIGADPNASIQTNKKERNTFLMHVIKQMNICLYIDDYQNFSSYKTIVTALLKSGANPNALDEDDPTQPSLIGYLVSMDTNHRIYFSELIETLVESELDVGGRMNLSQKENAFHYLSNTIDAAALQWLLMFNVNDQVKSKIADALTKEDDLGFTPMGRLVNHLTNLEIFSEAKDFAKIALVFLSFGAKINARSMVMIERYLNYEYVEEASKTYVAEVHKEAIAKSICTENNLPPNNPAKHRL